MQILMFLGRMSVINRKILFLSGTRADFGKIKSLISVVDRLDGFEYQIFCTGMHMLNQYGSTYKEIYKSGFKRVHKFINQYVGEPMDMVLANTIHGLSRFVHEDKPDLIVVHGDRIEALAGAIVGSMNNILVAHIEGGERSGTVDELIRHSVTKLSHIHLVSNEEAYQRIVQLGEREEAVYILGSPDIDVMLSDELPELSEVLAHYEIPYDDYHIAMFHPVTTEYEFFSEYADQFVDALIDSRQNYVVVYPNNDLGSDAIIKSYEKLKGLPNFRVFPSVKFESFLVLVENAISLIGNSSAGIREAPIYGIPTVNIGTRQDSRYRCESIIDCGYGKSEILTSIERVIDRSLKFEKDIYFGSGNSAKKFEQMLKNGSIFELNHQKSFVDFGVPANWAGNLG